MKIAIAVALFLGLVQSTPHSTEDPAPLDLDWLPGLGQVSVSAEGHRLRVSVQADASQSVQEFDLDELPSTARINAVKAGPWYGLAGIALVLAIEDGESTEYRLLLSREGRFDGDTLRSASLSTGTLGWFLSQPLFSSQGEPYRIVDVHNPGDGDALEITFRRGWPDLHSRDPRVDEKIFFDSCGGYWPEPLQPGRAVLYEVRAVRNAR